eukprot:scaffold242148_cov32-Tisochrysis_lutea.AAC.2
MSYTNEHCRIVRNVAWTAFVEQKVAAHRSHAFRAVRNVALKDKGRQAGINVKRYASCEQMTCSEETETAVLGVTGPRDALKP